MKSSLTAVAIAAAVFALFAACSSDALDPDRTAVESVVVSPTIATVAVGAQVPLTAEARDAAGNILTGRRVRWASEDPAIATVNDAGVVTGLKVGTVQIGASAEGKNAIAEITVNPTPVASVRVSPTSRELLVGESVQLVAEPLDVGGAVLPGRPITWTTSNSAVATVSSGGLVTAIAPGGAVITAASEGKTAVATLTISSVPVASVEVTPNGGSLVVGQTTQLQAQPRDGSGRALAGRVVAWSTSNASVATVTSTGLVTAVAPGNATISATSEGKSGSVEISVSPKPVSAVIVSPGQVSIIQGQTSQLTAQVTDDQGNVLGGRPINYSSNNTQVATVSGSGLVTAVAPGQATITANSEGKTGTATVNVLPIPVATVEVGPAQPNVVVGGTVQLTATAKSASGQVLGGRTVSWTTGAPGIASVSGAGVATGIAPGNAVIFATIDGVVGSVTVNVRQVPVASVTVAPPTANLTVGEAAQLTATVRDANGTVLSDRLVGWSSSDDAVAIVSSTGRVTALKAGTATITASSEGQSGTATVTVAPAAPTPVAAVSVSPNPLPLTVGQTGTLTATTRDAQGNVLTGRTVTWSTSNGNIATVSPNGTVTAVAAGSATITATSEGRTGTATVNVSNPAPAPVATVTVSPPTASLTVGGTQQATATLRDAQENVLTGRNVTWSSGNNNIATVNQSGLVTAVGVGSTNITATSEGRSGSMAVTVAAPAAGTVTVSPQEVTLTVAGTRQLAATVRDVNGNVMSGASVTWSTSNGQIATVSQNGTVTGIAPGNATITATSGGRSGTATITVQLAPVGRVTVSPQNPRVDIGETMQFTATVYDENDNILTGRTITWTSSNTQIATVSSTGLVRGERQGDVTITASTGGKSGSTPVRVRP